MTDLATELLWRVAEIDRRLDGMVRHGPVTDVDTFNHLVRMQVGLGADDATPMLSPWVPYAQIAGGLAVHTPPTVGQQMTLFSPGGDHRQGLALPMTWSAAVPSPSTGADPALTYGAVRIDMTEHGLLITCAAGVTVDAPNLSCTGNLAAGTGVTGTFTTPQGYVVTVRDGIIVNIAT